MLNFLLNHKFGAITVFTVGSLIFFFLIRYGYDMRVEDELQRTREAIEGSRFIEEESRQKSDDDLIDYLSE